MYKRIEDENIIMEERNKTREQKWPGFVLLIICALVGIFIPRYAWWGKLIGWIASFWFVVTVWYLWKLFTKKDE